MQTDSFPHPHKHNPALPLQNKTRTCTHANDQTDDMFDQTDDAATEEAEAMNKGSVTAKYSSGNILKGRRKSRRGKDRKKSSYQSKPIIFPREKV